MHTLQKEVLEGLQRAHEQVAQTTNETLLCALCSTPLYIGQTFKRYQRIIAHVGCLHVLHAPQLMLVDCCASCIHYNDGQDYGDHPYCIYYDFDTEPFWKCTTCERRNLYQQEYWIMTLVHS